MTLPFQVPDWVPWWGLLLIVVPALLYALAFLFMPFSVIGVKGRLDVLEARLDEIQHEIRHLSLRMPEPGQPIDYRDVYHPERQDVSAASQRALPSIRPPIPPARHELDGDTSFDRSSAGARPARREPRLDWPR